MSFNNLSDEDTPRSPNSGRSWRRQTGGFNQLNGTTALPSSPSSTQNTATNLFSNTSGVGLSESQLSAERRRKLDAIDQLHSLGVQRYIDLPQIVVIGSQSVGKSSLIESISDISLPRSSGTCTRCPIECRLVQTLGEPWQCTVSLRFCGDGFGRDSSKPRTMQFGSVIKNKHEVEERLRRAQRAILNPSIDPQQFVDGSYTNNISNVNFSVNCICVEIRGPNVTNLSFCDLPGLIASPTDGGRAEDVREVKDLVSSYISRSSCIILLTVACETDFAIQGAYQLAKEYDPEGLRTVGVLTKPDRIPEGEHSQWLRLIRNQSYALKNGWFCVKQPSSKELERGMTSQEALRRGEDFFKSSPWSGLDPVYQKRLGTNAVVQKLNEFLMAEISKRIPEIAQELQRLIQETKEQLITLPKPLSQDSMLELMHLTNNFINDLFSRAEGLGQKIWSETDGERKRRDNHFPAIAAAHETFKQKICSTAPNFKPCPSSEKFTPLQPAPFMSHEEGQNYFSSQKPVHLDEVTNRIEAERSRELPGYISPHVVNDLVADFVEKWKTPAFELIDDIYGLITKHQNFLIDQYFEKYSGGGLHHAVKNLMHEYMQKRREQAEQQVKFLLTLEKNNTFTLNKTLFQFYKDQFLRMYENRLQIQNADSDPGLTMMATVNAYFYVAYKRFIDMVPMAIDNELVRVDSRALEEELSCGLKMTDPQAKEHCRKLLAEPPTISSIREELEGRKDRLMAAQKELLSV